MAPTTLTFLGAAGTVTGSRFLLTLGDRRLLVDAGMFQGEKRWRSLNWADFPVDPAEIDAVVLTHAHMDHCGYLPALVRNGYRGPIWATEGTAALAGIVLRDAGFLQERDAQLAEQYGYSKHHPALPLYTVKDVERTLPLFRPVDYDTDVEIRQGVVCRWTRAGHILGSASVRVSTPSTAIVFSGDIGRHDHPVLRSRDTPPGAPYVVIESTYGDREHPEPPLAHEDFAEAIRDTVARGGQVLIPAFAVDRTEVVLKTIGELQGDGRIPSLPIYVNSPMALDALRLYRSAGCRDELRQDLDVDDFLGLADLHETPDAQDSRELDELQGPAIIISASGMATGGRVLHHLAHLLPDPRNTVILTGYQAAGTRGRVLEEGARELKLHGRYVPVRARVVRDAEFSVHADSTDLVDWLRDLDPAPETVFIVHGEPAASAALHDRISAELGLTCAVARQGEVVVVEPFA
ncbi:metallo-beta-lactamase family protein [Raineyella antarctica]|uniref:Metallo-beta-lactamase family protein n=1 Tax=Raineyella antarctica TaxID=1577474 RepID=A0A1G6H296_9ACTN|nr:MBL fold metallo-hydrolase [Raineyella antarctica]SDB88248.1 metallo-beta-lactamase family protein [Raineyella antarctica]